MKIEVDIQLTFEAHGFAMPLKIPINRKAKANLVVNIWDSDEALEEFIDITGL